MSRTAPGSPAWPRTVAALCLADTRRRLNLLVGARPSARRRRKAAWMVVGAGAAATLGTLTVVGRTLGALAPPGPAVRTELAAWTWTPVVVWFLHQVLTAEPAKARALVSPPDASVLRTLPVSRAQLVTARLVVPATGIAALVLTAATAVGAPWLAAGAEGRRLLPVFLLHCAGAAVTGVALHIALVTALMVRVVRIPHLPRLLVSAVVGGAVGAVTAPFVRALTGGDGPSQADVARIVGEALTAARPHLWTVAHRPGAAAWVAASYAGLTLLLTTTAVLRLRATVRRDAGLGDTAAARPVAGGRRPWSSSPYALVRQVTWLRFLRGHPQTVGGLARLQRLSVLLGTGCMGVVVGLGGPLWELPFAAVGGLFVAAALITTGEVVQVCGIEADRESWDVLRQAPRAAGAWVAAKIATASVAVAAVTGPFALGIAALCGVHGPAGWARAVLAWAAVAAATGCAVVLTYFLVPRSEAFAESRITRAPAAEVTEGLLVALLTLPVTAGAAVGAGGDVGHGVLLVLSLGTGWAVVRRAARSDLRPASVEARPAPETPTSRSSS
ncbi:hypothetical protein [Streptomyces sp. NPDC059828]|uniref:hypothetical protein n=1 Tax=Streptomyces sp. NPDC059828 TaxID=3346965 RepID=UPI00364EEB83